MNDSELLRRFVRGHDQRAFAELVRRHVDLVFNAALRHMRSDVHAANDITQQVFVDVAAKANQLIEHPCLSGWLYANTRFTALNTIRREQRRIARERDVMEEQETPITDWSRVRLFIDDALQDLDERERQLVILRYFSRQSFFAIAAQVGMSENAAQKAVARALELLNGALSRRGITSTGAALALALSHATAAAPAGVAEVVIASALGSGAVSGGVAAAAIGAAKIAVATIAVTGLSIGLGYWTGTERQITAGVRESLMQDRLFHRQLDGLDQRLRNANDQLAAVEAEESRFRQTAQPGPANVPPTATMAPTAVQPSWLPRRSPPRYPVQSRPIRGAANIIGAVHYPIRVEVGNGMTLHEVITKAGGLTGFANLREVRVTRSVVERGVHGVTALTVDLSSANPFLILPGDVVYVPERIQ